MIEQQDDGLVAAGNERVSLDTQPARDYGRLRAWAASYPLRSPFFRLLLITLFLSALHHSVALETAAYVAGLSFLGGVRYPTPFARMRVARARRVNRAASAQRSASRQSEIARAQAVLLRQHSAEAHLVGLGDKDVLFSNDGSAFIMYARQGGKLIALFDPVGSPECRRELVLAFRTLAFSLGCKPVFYQASPELLSLCQDLGMRGFKLGELAEIRLDLFEMKGKEWASLRRATNRAQRDGLEFEIVEPSDIAPLLPDIAAVSNAWLAQNNAREKRFSLGFFTEEYACAHPLAILRQDGKIVAFMNLLSSGESVFIDLMRFVPGVHRGLMDLLMVRTIEFLKDRGYRRLNLGMAPLSGLSAHRNAPLWDRAGRLVFERGNRFYNFKGLLAFKSKFDPQWKPRYLVVPKEANPFVCAAASAVLIGGGLKGVFRR